MRKFVLCFCLFAFAGGLLGAGIATAQSNPRNLFFLHNSVGRNLINGGDIRDVLDDFNAQNGSDLVFWDHDYNYLGIRDDIGEYLGYSYNVPNDDTDPEGLHYLWTTANAARDSILANHDVISFKSCYPASDIETDAELEQRKAWYRDMRDFFDQRPDHIFVVMSTPPRHRLATDLETADRARAFADWLKSPAYLAGHPNVVCYDIFDALAHPNDGSDVRNMLRYEYEISHTNSDSHPNGLANDIVGPELVTYLAQAALNSGSSTAVPDATPRPILAQNYPNPFNPVTTIAFELPFASAVQLQIVDMRGRAVRTLVQSELPAGNHTVVWTGRDDQGSQVPSGVYLYRLQAGRDLLMRKLILAK